MTKEEIRLLEILKTIMEENWRKGVEHPYNHYAVMKALEELIEGKKQQYELRRTN